ncbi:MAG: Asp/Glu racemase [Rhodobacteraceae bacterium]|nr:Asp/Glu racemase [Paracoccaceae bacterium]
MSHRPYELMPDSDLPCALGLIVLRADETLEPEFHEALADVPAALYVSRIPSAPEVTPDTLIAMKQAIPASADLLPKSPDFKSVGYGCTSASALLGSDTVAGLVKSACNARQVTDPLRAAVAFAHHHSLSRLALLSPYTPQVNKPLRTALAHAGVSTEVFATFAEAQEARVARIAESSIVEAACDLGSAPQVDGVFLSCTNLKTRTAIPKIQSRIGKPVFSSNSALFWHMTKCADLLKISQLQQ